MGAIGTELLLRIETDGIAPSNEDVNHSFRELRYLETCRTVMETQYEKNDLIVERIMQDLESTKVQLPSCFDSNTKISLPVCPMRPQ